LKEDQSGKGGLSLYLKDKFDELKVHSTKKQEIYDIVNKISDEIADLEYKRSKLLKNVHPKYNKLELIAKGVAEVTKTLETTTNDGKRERELIREIKNI
jgi:hypothetical protein